MIENNTNQTLSGTAVYNVSPTEAGKYFNKIECFCFTQQVIEGKSSMQLPLQFIVDEDLPDNTKTLILSYTMFNTTNQLGAK